MFLWLLVVPIFAGGGTAGGGDCGIVILYMLSYLDLYVGVVVLF